MNKEVSKVEGEEGEDEWDDRIEVPAKLTFKITRPVHTKSDVVSGSSTETAVNVNTSSSLNSVNKAINPDNSSDVSSTLQMNEDLFKTLLTSSTSSTTSSIFKSTSQNNFALGLFGGDNSFLQPLGGGGVSGGQSDAVQQIMPSFPLSGDLTCYQNIFQRLMICLSFYSIFVRR